MEKQISPINQKRKRDEDFYSDQHMQNNQMMQQPRRPPYYNQEVGGGIHMPQTYAMQEDGPFMGQRNRLYHEFNQREEQPLPHSPKRDPVQSNGPGNNQLPNPVPSRFPTIVNPIVFRANGGAPPPNLPPPNLNMSHDDHDQDGSGGASPSSPSPASSPTTNTSSNSLSSAPGNSGQPEWENLVSKLGDNNNSSSENPERMLSGSIPESTNPLDKLTSNQYLYYLRNMESRLKNIRARIIQRDLNNLQSQLQELRAQMEQFAEEFEHLKSNHFLKAGDFNNLLSLEEFLTTTLSPQLGLYELDFQQLTDPSGSASNEVPVYLSIVNQETAGPIFKEKALGPFTLRLLTGATITQIQSGPVQPELVDTSQRIKRNNQELENVKQNFQENGTATFTDLKFSSGTFPNLVRLKFRVTIQILQNGQRITKSIESAQTKPFVSMTNTGSQWKDAAGTWLKEELFKESYDVSIARLWNYFQKHYLISTKQEINNIKRPLYLKDFEFLLHAKYPQGTKKQTINQKEFTWFWDWVGPGLKRIRYQKYLLWLFENGYLAAFVTGKEAEEQLRNETPGTFLIRLSERLDGELVISYTHSVGM
eukprot:TRINITY_DN1209_c1_g1_i1.p1 TRINITY_DN1209_c1_g1~~TRINITY_DN1209_c1_g1_i1.p1  ORF type:complete len:592 (+),score=115.07 TRINITY_DN1209_c1_g1_i1:61-1836(+)